MRGIKLGILVNDIAKDLKIPLNDEEGEVVGPLSAPQGGGGQDLGGGGSSSGRMGDDKAHP